MEKNAPPSGLLQSRSFAEKLVHPSRLNTNGEITQPNGLGETEIVEYGGKWFQLILASSSVEGLKGYSAVIPVWESQKRDWFVVDGYTSEKHNGVTAVFVEIPEQTPEVLAIEYRDAVQRIGYAEDHMPRQKVTIEPTT